MKRLVPGDLVALLKGVLENSRALPVDRGQGLVPDPETLQELFHALHRVQA